MFSLFPFSAKRLTNTQVTSHQLFREYAEESNRPGTVINACFENGFIHKTVPKPMSINILVVLLYVRDAIAVLARHGTSTREFVAVHKHPYPPALKVRSKCFTPCYGVSHFTPPQVPKLVSASKTGNQSPKELRVLTVCSFKGGSGCQPSSS